MGNNRHPWIDDRLPQLLEAAGERWPGVDLSNLTVVRGVAVVPVFFIARLNVRMGFDPKTRTLVICDP